MDELEIINALRSDKTKVYTEEELYWCTGGNTGRLPNRITPSKIIDMNDGEVFTFGSNVRGCHAGGAARYAHDNLGAIWGQGEGLQGKCYAIPTMEGIESMKAAIDRFTEFAGQHPELKFYVTPIACGIAGYSPEEIAPMFYDAVGLPNVYLPLSFWKVIVQMGR